MKKETKRNLCVALVLLAAFVIWTLLVSVVDKAQIGPQSSSVGLSSINGFAHEKTGVNMGMYAVTDWLGLVPIATCLGFAILGLLQWIRRKSILMVDRDILALGCFYALVVGVFILFENAVVNYRPVLIDGRLEASYPSSTTLLTMCVMPTAAMQLHFRLHRKAVRRAAVIAIIAFTVFMVVGRLLSGVHWLSDIIGGVLLSGGLVMLYESLGAPRRVQNVN